MQKMSTKCLQRPTRSWTLLDRAVSKWSSVNLRLSLRLRYRRKQRAANDKGRDRDRLKRDETPEKGPGEGDGVTAPGDKPKEIWLDTYDVDYLHEREAEAQPEGFGLVAHRPLQHVVRLQQVVQQPLLVVTATYQPCPITISSQWGVAHDCSCDGLPRPIVDVASPRASSKNARGWERDKAQECLFVSPPLSFPLFPPFSLALSHFLSLL